MNANQGPAPVVVAVDGTARSAGAAAFAVREAARRATALRIVHVTPSTLPVGGSMPYVPYPIDDLMNAGREILEKAVSDARASVPDLEVEGELRRGPRVTELLSASEPASLMVLGRESRHGVERVFTGATTTGVAARTRVPLAVVPRGWQSADRHRVVVGIKSLGTAGEVLSYAFALASSRGAALRVVHVWQVPDPYAATLVQTRSRTGAWVSTSNRILETIVDGWRDSFPDVAVETTAVQGQPAHCLIDAAEAADLLVVARHRRDLEHLARLGPTSRAIIGFSDTPVVVVPLTGAPASASAPLVLERSGDLLKD